MDSQGAVGLQVVLKQERGDVSTPRMESNKDNPIVIDSDEEDHILSAVRKQLPSDEESDLPTGPPEEPTEKSNKQKVSSDKALRILLRGKWKGKLSINRATLRKTRELEIENMRLLQLLKEGDERLQSYGLGLIPGGTTNSPSASTGRSFQATTSIASTPQIFQSKANLAPNSARNAVEDFITGTQDSTLLQSKRATVTATEANLKGFQGWEVMHIKKNGCISDQESSSPKLCYFKQHQPKRQIFISKLYTEDIDEVTSSLKE